MLNSLRFGSLDSPRVRYLFAGVVKGIGDYGNCVGIPTVAGDIFFDPAYEGNPLVNAMCVGLMHENELIRAVAQGVGNPIIAVGARTGRDGIHGASFASKISRAERRQAAARAGRRPVHREAAARGEPRADQSGAIVAIQDMGAAGSRRRPPRWRRVATSESRSTRRSARARRGMTPYEILLSESQERMLVVAKRGREDEVHSISRNGISPRAVIGEVIAEPVYRVTEGERVVAEFPELRLVTDCPTYTPGRAPRARRCHGSGARRFRDRRTAGRERSSLDAAQLLSSPTSRSPRHGSIANTPPRRAQYVIRPGGDAAVVAFAEAPRPRREDRLQRTLRLPRPRIGTQIAVCSPPQRRLHRRTSQGHHQQLEHAPASAGSVLPLRESIRAWQPVRRSERRSPAGTCRSTTRVRSARCIPRRHRHGRIDRAHGAHHARQLRGRKDTDRVAWRADGAHSAPASTWRASTAWWPDRRRRVDLVAERSLVDALLDAFAAGLVRSAHDCSDGGLAVALAECCIMNRELERGATVDLSSWSNLPERSVLFGEAQGRVVVTTTMPTRCFASQATTRCLPR
jgi:phosphoribosylformylglycinamidine synthase